MTAADRTSRLRELGYNETKASFLLLAALHSGCFVMRQYTDFANVPRGRFTDQLATKAAMRLHITSYPSRNRTIVYQVGKGYSKPLATRITVTAVSNKSISLGSV